VPVDRFDHASHLRAAGSYTGHRGAFWPPVGDYAVTTLDLAPSAPDLGDRFRGNLAALGDAVEEQWRAVKVAGSPGRTRFPDPQPAAAALRALADDLPGEVDRRAATLRARALADGYDDEILQALVGMDEDVAVVAGQLATWYGKENAGLPTAFACRRDDARQAHVTDGLATLDAVGDHLRRLHPDLRLAPVPAFAVTDLFFMAGEGERHPKHIAYFLPEDEGVKRSPFKKTYHFGNTHRALLHAVSGPLAARHLDVGAGFDPADPRFAVIPTLGVLGHELGHSVHRPATRYKALNAADRWASVVVQEVAADVFGALVLAEVWAAELGVDPADALAYYLAECLRYTDRGLGFFPDSDGMFLQLSYYTAVGALTVKQEDTTRLVGDPGTVLAGVRSLARVLADATLTGDAEPALALWRTYGPGAPSALAPLVDELRARPFTTLDYGQEHVR
jgi:hypothetical protein